MAFSSPELRGFIFKVCLVADQTDRKLWDGYMEERFMAFFGPQIAKIKPCEIRLCHFGEIR